MSANQDAVERARLAPLLEATEGDAGVRLALVDGPVAPDHPELAAARLVRLAPPDDFRTAKGAAAAEAHGTFLAGVLCARRGGPAPALCPGATLLVRPVFADADAAATTADLTGAILACLEAGARVINLSVQLAAASTRSQRALEQALDAAAERGSLVVVAAGDPRRAADSALTRHPASLVAVAVDRSGRPVPGAAAVWGASDAPGRLGAPGGEAVVSLSPDGGTTSGSGSSVATAFVSGAAVLLWSLVPGAPASVVRDALLGGGNETARTRAAPGMLPLLDGAAALRRLRGEAPCLTR